MSSSSKFDQRRPKLRSLGYYFTKTFSHNIRGHRFFFSKRLKLLKSYNKEELPLLRYISITLWKKTQIDSSLSSSCSGPQIVSLSTGGGCWVCVKWRACVKSEEPQQKQHRDRQEGVQGSLSRLWRGYYYTYSYYTLCR